MGKIADYKCKKCSHVFESKGGGGFIFDEYRCVDCDQIKAVKLKSKSERVPVEDVGKCSKCGGGLRKDLDPMCPKCKSREVECVKTKMFYD